VMSDFSVVLNRKFHPASEDIAEAGDYVMCQHFTVSAYLHNLQVTNNRMYPIVA